MSCPDNEESDADDDLDVVSNPADSCVASPSQGPVSARVSDSPSGNSSINGKRPCYTNLEIKFNINLMLL